MLSPKDKRKIRHLQKDGYLSDSNPLTGAVMAAVRGATEPRQEWLEAFLTLAHDGDVSVREVIHDEDGVNVTETAPPLFQLLGRFDDGDGCNSPRILACIIRRGLGTRVKDLALELDMDVKRISEVRVKWECEIRALLQDALCLGLTGEDLYHAVTIPDYQPTRLIERITELRKARTDDDVPGVLPGQYEQELRSAWFNYRTRQGLHGRAPDMPVNPPRWFVNMLLSE
jgi:hypothetical protein